ncbi:hypothetical protein E4T47_02770 [Aureobasidium subglaciale]|nr:hypothetical protein E4T43_03722 [Aureobasidium subglaciale]KAI5274269.1 hypothetical protein E4T47_02770 [Aureobasidium subglaciale]
MHSRKIVHIWTLLAVPVTMVLGLPISDIDTITDDCDSWDPTDKVDSYPSTSIISNTAFIASTAVNQLSPSTTPSPTTFAQVSSTSICSSTKAFIAPSNTFTPVTPPSYAFYLQSGSSAGRSKVHFAVVSAGIGGSVTFTTNKAFATKFTIDSSGDLVEQSPSQGYVATLDADVDTQKLSFSPYGGSSTRGRLNCRSQDASNIIAQLLEQRSKQIPWTMSMPDLLRFIMFTLLTAPPNYLWQHALERAFPGRKALDTTKPTLPRYEIREHDGLLGGDAIPKEEEAETRLDWQNTMIKWFVDCMTLGALLNVAAFLILMGIMKGKSTHQIGSALRTDTFPIIYASYKIWPLASIVNFAFVPVERRIVFLSAVGLVWGIFLSLTAAKQ